jgi:hypothetical protein
LKPKAEEVFIYCTATNMVTLQFKQKLQPSLLASCAALTNNFLVHEYKLILYINVHGFLQKAEVVTMVEKKYS